MHGLARRVPPPTLWQELHAYYRLAELLDCAVTAVSDDLQPHAVGVSCYSTYCHALLLGLADPCAMSVRQIELADRWLGQWARKIFPYAQQRETEGPVMLMDLDSSVGAWIAAAAPANPPASMRFGYPGKLATSVRGRMKRLAAGVESGGTAARPRHVGRGIAPRCSRISTASGTSCPSRDGDAVHEELQLTAGGVPAAYFRVGGRTFDRQDPLGRLTFQGAQHLQTLGALTDYDRYKEEAERNWPWERWQGEYAWREASLIRRESTRYRWFLDQLIVVRDAERTRVAYVTRVAFNPPGEISLSLAFYAGQPRSIAVRPTSHAFAEELPMPALMLGSRRRRAGVADRAAAHVQPGSRAAVDGYGAGAQVPPDQARCSGAGISSGWRSTRREVGVTKTLRASRSVFSSR